MLNPYLEEAVAKNGCKPTNGYVLALMPVSGQALRFRGRFFVMNYRASDGLAYQCPAVLLQDGTPHRLDPRCLVFDDETLARWWHPRESAQILEPVAREWLEKNPDVFKVAGPLGAIPVPADAVERRGG